MLEETRHIFRPVDIPKTSGLRPSERGGTQTSARFLHHAIRAPCDPREEAWHWTLEPNEHVAAVLGGKKDRIEPTQERRRAPAKMPNRQRRAIRAGKQQGAARDPKGAEHALTEIARHLCREPHLEVGPTGLEEGVGRVRRAPQRHLAERCRD